MEKVKKSASEFVGKITERLEELGIDVKDKEMDHICWWCETEEEYNIWLDQQETLNKRLLTQK